MWEIAFNLRKQKDLNWVTPTCNVITLSHKVQTHYQ